MTMAPQVRVAYVVRSWPRLSQTFIVNEVVALEQLGLDLAIFSMSRPDEPLAAPQAERVRAPVRYLGTLMGPLNRVRAHVRLAAATPRRYAAALAFVARNRHLSVGYSTASRWRCFDYAVELAGVARADAAAGRPLAQIHAHFAHDPALVGLLAQRLTGVPFSLTAHARDLYGIPAKALAARARDASAVVTCCQANADYLAAFVESDRLHLVHHGVDLESFRPCLSTAGGEPPLILSVGRLVEKKGFPELLHACALLAQGGHRFRCVIYGEGPMGDALATLRDELGLREAVALAGPRSPQELVAIFQSADVFALTPFVAANGDRDGVPNVLVEAMACGIPVVSTQVGGIPELVRHGENGLLAAPQDVAAAAAHLARLLDDPGLRRRLGAAARSTVEADFDTRVAAHRLATLFGAVPSEVG
jgi:glycosyltransferase involved in cell wall biosynthesis